MLINSSTTVQIHTHSPTTSLLILTPYLPVHVRRYHAWMQDPHIRELTASDPLTLEEEYTMQRSWRSDYDKLTFIVYSHGSGYETRNNIDKRNRQLGEEGMVGDVNLFLFLDDEDDNDTDEHMVNATNNFTINDNDNDDGSHDNNSKIVIGELELMLAEPSARGRGLGSAMLLALLMYVAKHEREIVAGFRRGRHEDEVEGESEGRNKPSSNGRGSDDSEGKRKNSNKIEHFRVRIAKDNIRSLKLFEGLGFKRTNDEPNYFGEIEMRRYPSPAKGWEGDVQEMMREKRLDGWEERQMDLVG